MNDIAQLMRAANPVPDSEAALTDDEFDALLLLTQARSGNMDVQQLEKPVEPEKRQRSGWLVAAVAFAVVIVFVGVAMLLARPAAETPPATTPPTTEALTPTTQAAPPTTEAASPTTVAPVVEAEPVMTDEILALLTNYEAAFNNADAAAFRALFTPDARFVQERNPGNTVSVDRLVGEMVNLRRQESTLALVDCTATSYGARCKFVYSGAVETALFYGPATNTIALYIDGGQITELGLRATSLPGVIPDPWQQVLDWVEENFPEDREDMISPMINDILASEDSELWLKYAPLWQEAGRPYLATPTVLA